MSAISTPARRPRLGRLRPIGQGLAVLALLLAIRAWTQRGTAAGAAPPLTGPSLTGHPLSLADHRGKPVMVHFWATWCQVCDAENGTIDAFARDHVVLTVATDSGQADQIRTNMARRGLSFPVVVDAEGSLARAWGVKAFPTSFFVDPEQTIRFVETGFTSGLGMRTRLWLADRRSPR